MRNILFIAVVAGVLLAACTPRAGFTVNGTIEGVADGKVLLIVSRDNVNDTIAAAPLEKGEFTLSGKVDEVTLATLLVAGTSGNSLRLFIENAPFTVKIGTNPTFNGQTLVTPGSPTTIEGGGPVQQVYTRFFYLQQELAFKSLELRAAYFATPDATRKDSIQKVMQESRERIAARQDELTRANPDSYATAYVVYVNNASGDLEQLKEAVNLLGEEARATRYGRLLLERISLVEATSIGQVAPDFKLATPGGDTISLHGIQAKVKLIDFWASWCGPCRAENPNVVKAYAEYHPKGLEILGVSLDTDREKWLQAIDADKLTWKQGSDLQGWQAAPAKLYAVNAIPCTLLLDEDNKIIAKNLRGDALRLKLVELLY